MYLCEKCGILVTTNFGSGRFCSRSCANGHKHSIETKKKIGKALSIQKIFVVKNCEQCNKQFITHKIYQRFCCQRCANIAISKNPISRKKISIARLKAIENGKIGYGIKCLYDGIRCDSALEYAFCKKWKKDHPESTIKRWHGIIEKYGIKFIPDFSINEKPIEIKHTYVNKTNGLAAKWKTYVETQVVKRKIIEDLGGMYITEQDIGVKFYKECLAEVHTLQNDNKNRGLVV